jgi:hypothetical protein
MHIYDYIPCIMRSMSVLEEILEMFATTVQAELNAPLHVCDSGLQFLGSSTERITLYDLNEQSSLAL